MLNNRAYSATALNIYLKCPRQYLYDKILKLGSKDGNPDAKSYGSAIHKACEIAINYALENQKHINKNDFIDSFKKELNRLPMSSYEQRQIHLERGELSLDKYYNVLSSTPASYFKNAEYELKFEINGHNFIGYIDRIDKNEDNTLSIYDYKTGKAKTKSSIGVKKSHEDYYNQMGFYKFAIEKLTGQKVKETTFIFPDECEKKLSIEYSEEDIKEIIEKYTQAIRNIENLEFEAIKNKDKEKEPCLYCGFKDFCNLETL